MADLSATTWGDPASPKHVLLLHGIMCLGQFWNRTARLFASRGYFVVAPDLIGHGCACRGSDYTIAAFVEALRPLLKPSDGSEHRYHIVVGHSLGGLVGVAMLPLLKSTRPIHVLLIDPPFEQTPEEIVFFKGMFGDVLRNPKSAEEYHQEEPHFPKEDLIFKSMAVRMCSVATLESILDQNNPWSFTSLVAAAPDNVKVTVVAVDPAKPNFVKPDDFKEYPHVTVKTVLGASHAFPLERPELVVEMALEGTEKEN